MRVVWVQSVWLRFRVQGLGLTVWGLNFWGEILRASANMYVCVRTCVHTHTHVYMYRYVWFRDIKTSPLTLDRGLGFGIQGSGLRD